MSAFRWPTNYLVVTQRWAGTDPAEPGRYHAADAEGWARASRSTFAGAHYSKPYHNGLDMRAYAGTNLYSVAPGTVESHPDYTSPNTGTVNHRIRIRISPHCRVTYAHLTAGTAIPIGTKVVAGTVVGKSGMSGTLEAHLHFEVEVLYGTRWFECNPENFMPAHKLKDGTPVAAGTRSIP